MVFKRTLQSLGPWNEGDIFQILQQCFYYQLYYSYC